MLFPQSPGAGVIVAGCVGALITALLIRLMSVIAPRIGLVDLPSPRKIHEGAVPLVGGLALCSAYLMVALVMLPGNAIFLPVAAGICLLMAGGLLDDLLELRPRVRLGLQALAAFIMIAGAGIQLHSLGDLLGMGNIELSPVAGFLFTMFCAVSVINGLNMLDGLDGLAGGVGAIMLLGFVAAAAVMGLASNVAHLSVFLSCLLVFLLLHNARSPLRRRLVFMGDAGSMVLGFLIAFTAIHLAEQPGGDSMYPITAVWITGLVVLDTIATVVRRALQKRNPLSPGRDHLHHLLLELGLSSSRVVAILYLATATMTAVGLAAWFLEVPELVLTAAFVVISALYYAGVSYGWRMVAQGRRVVVEFVPPRPSAAPAGDVLENERDLRAS